MADNPYTRDSMQKRFHELNRKADAIRAKAAPLREERDNLAQSGEITLKQRRDFDAKIVKTEAGLFDLDSEKGLLARALNGQTGNPNAA